MILNVNQTSPQYTSGLVINPNGVVANTTVFTAVPNNNGFSIGPPQLTPRLVLLYAQINVVPSSSAVFNVRLHEAISNTTIAETRVTPFGGLIDVPLFLFAPYLLGVGQSNSFTLEAKFDGAAGQNINFGASVPCYFGLIL